MPPKNKNPQPDLVIISDKNDVELGTMERSEAVAKGQRYRAVHVILTNADDTILVQWRTSTKPESPRTFTASAAGAVDVGETYEQAAHRELQEELGITKKLKLTALGPFQTKSANAQLFTATFSGDVKGWEAEADAIDYLNRAEAEYLLKRYPYLLAPSFQQSLKLFLKETK